MFAAKDRPQQGAAVSPRPLTVAFSARINGDLCQDSQKRPSRSRTLLPAQNFQRPYFHPLPDSLQQEQNITPVFPITPALSLRSFAQERKSTPLVSCACARFCRWVGVIFPTFSGCGLYLEPTEKTVWAVLAAPERNWEELEQNEHLRKMLH
jgi:hypothetical protein